MTDLLDLQPGDRVLEVGTGWGYQTAVLAEMGARVYSIELIAALADEARRRLARQGHSQVTVRVGDGRAGWPEQAPFDKVIVSAAPDWVPVPCTGSNTVSVSGPPVVLLFTTRKYDMQQFRGSVTAYFYYVNAIGLSLLVLRGIVGMEQFHVVVQLLPSAIVGGFVGRWLLRFVSQSHFRRITLVMLLVTGTIGIVTALQALIG